MVENTKCECGHQNHVGTVLCESCGKPLFDDEQATELLEMRYDGVARRSQRMNPKLFDRVWNFFSSVKIAVYLIVITLIAASVGTIYPQETTFINIDPAVHYEQEYGWTGKWYYLLGFSDTYNSWWFISLLVMIGISLVVCSIDRVLPLYRALSRQKVAKHPQFLARQRVVYRSDLQLSAAQSEEWTSRIASHLRSKRYRVTTENGALLAEKNRFSRWGPYVNHIGLIIFLLAILMRSIPGWHMDEHFEFPEKVAVKIPGTNYYLKNEQFTADFYEKDELAPFQQERGDQVARLYETKAILYECSENCEDTIREPVLKEVHRHDIRVNRPLDYKGLMVYQVDYNFTPKLLAVNVAVVDKQSGQSFDKFRIDMDNPAGEYRSGPYRLELKNYFPDFDLDENRKPISKSKNPNRPALIFIIKGPGLDANGETFIYFPIDLHKQAFSQDALNGEVGKKIDISAESMADVEISRFTSFLNVREERAMPYIYAGAFIFMIGVTMGMYWQHRRIWLRIDDGHLLLGAHTNKNWYSLRKDVQFVLAKMNLQVDHKQLENKGGNSIERGNNQ